MVFPLPIFILLSIAVLGMMEKPLLIQYKSISKDFTVFPSCLDLHLNDKKFYFGPNKFGPVSLFLIFSNSSPDHHLCMTGYSLHQIHFSGFKYRRTNPHTSDLLKLPIWGEWPRHLAGVRDSTLLLGSRRPLVRN